MIGQLALVLMMATTGCWALAVYATGLLLSPREGWFPARGIVYDRDKNPKMFRFCQFGAIVMCAFGLFLLSLAAYSTYLLFTTPEVFVLKGAKR